MFLDPTTQNVVQRAERIYEQSLKSRLEAEHFGSLIAVEPESGGYVLADTFREIDMAVQRQFGNQPVHIFRVGGGGAVKIGGIGRSARLS